MQIGTWQPNSPGSTGQLAAFGKALNFTPRIASYYSNFGQAFALVFANLMAEQGTKTLVQWQPRGYTNKDIAAGKYDTYIEKFAHDVGTVNGQVIISYGQEMNGNWYPWAASGWGNSNPADYIAAYRHIVLQFKAALVNNVTWLWDPNVSYNGSVPLKNVYPGDQYVDWVGLDGYYSTPETTFARLFQPSIDEIRKFTGKPLCIGEFGVTGSTAPSQIAGLFAGAYTAGAVAVVYFDEAQSGDSMHQDWRLENNPPATAAFRVSVWQYAERPLNS